MHIKKMMNVMIENGKNEDMHYLGEVAVDSIYNLKHTNPMWYHNIEVNMHKRAYGNNLLEDDVKCQVAKFENKDGSMGEHWDYDTVMSVYKARDLKCNFNDFYYALNLMWSKHYNTKYASDTELWIGLAIDFIMNEDVVEYFYKHRK